MQASNTKPASALSLKGRALKYLAAREHSRQELARKLATKTEEPVARINAVLDELEAKGLLSAQRYVDSVLHRRAAQLGAARVKRELQQQGVDGALVSEAVAHLQGSELERATQLWQRRYGQRGADADAKEVARQTRFLLSRGFSGEVVRQVLRHPARHVLRNTDAEAPDTPLPEDD